MIENNSWRHLRIASITDGTTQMNLNIRKELQEFTILTVDYANKIHYTICQETNPLHDSKYARSQVNENRTANYYLVIG